MKPHEIRYLSVNLTAEVGANDALIGVRVVPAGRDGNIVFGRTLAEDEADSGEPVAFYPYAGDELHFRPGSVQVFLRDLDRGNETMAGGYAPVANVLWTWVVFCRPPDPSLARYLFAVARRLDSAHALCADVLERLTDRRESFIKARQRLFGALGSAESMCVALGRAVDMLCDLPTHFQVNLNLPAAVTSVLPAVRAFRNAFEHIEDRALGRVKKKPHPDALTIFDQRDLISRGVLRYAAHSLDLISDVLPVLVQTRVALLHVAAGSAGAVQTINSLIRFAGAPPGSYERIRERAYFLWANRSGMAWWDAESNWFEAERTDASELQDAG